MTQPNPRTDVPQDPNRQPQPGQPNQQPGQRPAQPGTGQPGEQGEPTNPNQGTFTGGRAAGDRADETRRTEERPGDAQPQRPADKPQPEKYTGA